jgi:ATP-dependent DNA helicase DinG
MLDRVEEMIRPNLEQSGIRVFRQGTMPRHRMLTSFREEPGALLGADSFWQGVDVPGDALSCVILVRLPFQVPTNPVYEARMEALRAENIDGFKSYALPSAVIRFRQGFGRLIRSSEDRGVVVVLDNRLVAKWYGQAFLSSLPAVNLAVENSGQAVESVLRWLGSQ